MTKKALALGSNLVLGNSLLIFLEANRTGEPMALTLLAGFSLSAVTLLLIFFKFIRPRMALWKITFLSAAISFLVPLFGVPLWFFFEGRPEGAANGFVIGAILSIVGWTFWFPMWILNLALFWWISLE